MGIRMSPGKGAYIRKITSSLTLHAKSVEVGKEIEGSSPPSVFIGSHEYPKVYAGPMIAPMHGDTRIMDTPESWIPSSITQEEIIGYRMALVRGKHRVGVSDLENCFVEKLQDIALSSVSIESEAVFLDKPAGSVFSDESAPHGPSARIDHFEIGEVRWDNHLEKVYYDTDLKSRDAVLSLHEKGVPFSGIQKALSAGTMGLEKKRRLVPTRWSITACDTIIGDHLRETVIRNDLIDCYQVHEYESLNNHYAVLLMPTPWQYEWIEAFLHVLGPEEMVFADHEGHRKKQGYSTVGGCFYTCRMAVLDALAREGKQAGAVVFREAHRGYIPLGVFNVRENVRHAMASKALEFEGLGDALRYISAGLSLPLSRFHEESTLFRGLGKVKQTQLTAF